MNGPRLVKGRVGGKKTKLQDWSLGPGPFGAMVIQGLLLPAGEDWRRQLFAITHGFAVTDAGMVRLDGPGEWRLQNSP